MTRTCALCGTELPGTPPVDADAILDELRDSCGRMGMTVWHDGTVDTETAALLLGRAVRTLENWRSAGTGPEYVAGKRIRYRLTALAAWLATERAK